MLQHGLEDLEEEARPIFDGTAVFVGAPVGGLVEELGDQVEVVRLDLHAVEAGLDRVARCLGIVRHGLADFVASHWAWRDGWLAATWRHAQLDRIDVGGGHRQGAVEEVRMRQRAGVPELREDTAARLVDRVGDTAPAAHLFRAPQARRIRPAIRRRADRGAFPDD